jgi:hypothetical protein
MSASAKTGSKAKRRAGARPQAGAARVRARAELAAAELPEKLGQLTARMRVQCGELERQVDRVQARYRRQAARLLREASEEIGRLEALGQRHWRTLDTRARRRLASLLERVESALGSEPGARTEQARKAAHTAVRRAQQTLRKAAGALAP